MNALMPAIQGPLSLASFVSTPSVSERLAPEPDMHEPIVSEYFMSEEELNELLREFAEHGEKLDRLLTEKEEIDCFKRFCQAIKQALESVGTFSEGGGEDDEPDFISWSQDDPARILRVSARVPVTLETARKVLAACNELGSEHAVVFKGKEGRCVVFSNGDFCREE
jgi:hypothetical protein